MSDREPALVRCEILEERERSIHILQRQARGGEKREWLPRSQLEHISKRKNEEGKWEADIEMPEWLADEKGLDYR